VPLTHAANKAYLLQHLQQVCLLPAAALLPQRVPRVRRARLHTTAVMQLAPYTRCALRVALAVAGRVLGVRIRRQ